MLDANSKSSVVTQGEPVSEPVRPLVANRRTALPEGTFLDGSYSIKRVVGFGGFGITYEAIDINLGTQVAIKEYFPHEFGDRDHSMSVRPTSEHSQRLFDWGRTNFLKEARTLASFDHPGIVRVQRVFEANATAYMVMKFEKGASFEAWLKGLGRKPTQEELDFIVAPLLDALRMMHDVNYLHRDIAPDNIIIRPDNTPVLLDFGSARHVVAEMSRSLTGIVKAGYSPQEQYASDNRLQGPWTDLYALGGTLYRAIAGAAPLESLLRFDTDEMVPAVKAGGSAYRKEFLEAIDACLSVRPSARPQSVEALRPKLLGSAFSKNRLVAGGAGPAVPETAVVSKPTATISSAAAEISSAAVGLLRPLQKTAVVIQKRFSEIRSEVPKRVSEVREKIDLPSRLPSSAVGLLLLSGGVFTVMAGGTYAVYDLMRRQQPAVQVEVTSSNASVARDIDVEEQQRRAQAEAERRQRQAFADAEAERVRRIEAQRMEDERKRAAQAEAERKRIEDEAERRRQAEAEEQRKRAAAEAERERIAQVEREKKLAEDLRLASLPNEAQKTAFNAQLSELLRKHKCLAAEDAPNQQALDKLIERTNKASKVKLAALSLTNATVGDYETWLREASAVQGEVCFEAPQQKQIIAPRPQQQQVQQPQAPRYTAPRQQYQAPRNYAPRGGGGGTITGIQ